MFYPVAVEGRRRVLGGAKKAKHTFESLLHNLGFDPQMMGEFEDALDCYYQALWGRQRVPGKTHPETLRTIKKIGDTYFGRLKDFTNAEAF